MNALSRILSGLRDVDEVQGSFLLSGDGTLLARDLPPVFHEGLFADVGPRLARLRDTFDASNGSSTLTMRFTDHKLHVRSVGSKLLCVLSGASVNGPALRMAMNLVARHVDHGDENDVDIPAPTTRPSPPTLDTSDSTEPPGSRREVFYRGHRL
jgi:predicted regulator of Ras-like GTPase activity (Roadblock/LC7/MglB family)